MKHTIRIATISLFTCLAAKAAPFMAVGDNAELFVTAAALVQSDDNIYLSSSSKSDTVFSFTPGLDLVFGKGSMTTGDVYYREEIRRYSSHSKQDTELASVGATGAYENGVTKANFNASYAEVAQNQVGATLSSDIAQRNLTNLGGKTEFGISEKTALSIGLTYAKTDYIPTAFADSSIVSIPVNVYYKATPKLDWSLGYSYRATNLTGGSGIDSKDHFINLGARGEFDPKLTGEVHVGYTKRSFDVGSDANLFGVDGNLAYAFSDKTSLNFNISNDFGNAGTGVSTKNFILGANVTSHLTDQWSVTAGLSRRAIAYAIPSHTDDYVEGSVSATYVYNTYFNVTASYTYRNNSSDLAGSAFTNNVFALGANVRY